jgi:type II secretory ATPase GspE/PulE/Tfp pilus assembly ATPase PilB-like protein
VAMGLATEQRLASTLAGRFKLPFVDLDRCAPDPEAAREVPRSVVAAHGVLPLGSDGRVLYVAIDDPLAIEPIDQIRFQSDKQICEVLATPSQLRRYVERYLEEQAAPALEAEGGVDQILEDLAVDEQPPREDGDADGAGIDAQEGDSAAIRLANQIILDAYRDGASDIHIEPNGQERGTLVRFRVDGECVGYKEIPPAYRRSLVARLKVMARLDLSERRKPQDGKIRLRIEQRTIELRVATIPTVNGNEDMVLRVLASSRPAPLEKMGMSPRNLAALKRLVARPYGLVLCVGPTGSGKTTTLHSALGTINKVDRKIWTAEDPVEITQSGLRQVQVNARIGLTFAAALRSFLRADPDVIMVGEMRDEETARIAIEASLTGHLVFSTLHTNSAAETVTRLLDMGLDPFTFSDALLGVLAQRLARTLCKSCREPYEGSRAEWDEMAAISGEEKLVEQLGAPFGPGFVLWRPRGCGACGPTGYRGRCAIHELLVSDDRVRELVARKAPVDQIRRAAMEGGMTTLREDGVDKALAGLVDMRQVLAITSG